MNNYTTNKCRKNSYGLTAYGAGVLSSADMELVDEDEATQ